MYNPALLDSTAHGRLALGYTNYFAGSNMGYAAYAHDVEGVATFSGAVQFLGYGTFDRLDPDGNPEGTFNANDFLIQTSAGIALDTAYSVGATVKFLYSDVAGFSSTALAVDLGGTYYNAAKRFTAGLVIRNLGVQLTTYSEEAKEELPFDIQLGISKRFKHAPVRFSIIAENLQQWDLTYDNPNEIVAVDPITGEEVGGTQWVFGDQLMRHIVFGTEFILSESFQVRVGYNYRRRQEMKISEKPGMAGMSFGVGFRVKKFDFAYSRATYHLAGSSNQLSIATRLSNW